MNRHKLKSAAFKALLKDKKMADVIFDGMDAKFNSPKRKRAADVLKSVGVTITRRQAMMDGQGGPADPFGRLLNQQPQVGAPTLQNAAAAPQPQPMQPAAQAGAASFLKISPTYSTPTAIPGSGETRSVTGFTAARTPYQPSEDSFISTLPASRKAIGDMKSEPTKEENERFRYLEAKRRSQGLTSIEQSQYDRLTASYGSKLQYAPNKKKLVKTPEGYKVTTVDEPSPTPLSEQVGTDAPYKLGGGMFPVPKSFGQSGTTASAPGSTGSASTSTDVPPPSGAPTDIPEPEGTPNADVEFSSCVRSGKDAWSCVQQAKTKTGSSPSLTKVAEVDTDAAYKLALSYGSQDTEDMLANGAATGDSSNVNIWYQSLLKSDPAMANRVKPLVDAYNAGMGAEAFGKAVTMSTRQTADLLGIDPKVFGELPVGVLDGPIRDTMIEMQKQKFDLDKLEDDLANRTSVHRMADPLLRDYMRGRDQYLGTLEKAIEDFDYQMAYTDTSDPVLAQRANMYRQYLTTLYGEQNQRYMGILNDSIAWENESFERATRTYEARMAEATAYLEGVMDDATAFETAVAGMYTAIDERKQSAIDAQKAEHEARMNAMDLVSKTLGISKEKVELEAAKVKATTGTDKPATFSVDEVNKNIFASAPKTYVGANGETIYGGDLKPMTTQSLDALANSLGYNEAQTASLVIHYEDMLKYNVAQKLAESTQEGDPMIGDPTAFMSKYLGQLVQDTGDETYNGYNARIAQALIEASEPAIVKRVEPYLSEVQAVVKALNKGKTPKSNLPKWIYDLTVEAHNYAKEMNPMSNGEEASSASALVDAAFRAYGYKQG